MCALGWSVLRWGTWPPAVNKVKWTSYFHTSRKIYWQADNYVYWGLNSVKLGSDFLLSRTKYWPSRGRSGWSSRVQEAAKWAAKWILEMKTVDFLRSRIFKIMKKMRGNFNKSLYFLKFVISIRSSHCDYSPGTPKRQIYYTEIECQFSAQ